MPAFIKTEEVPKILRMKIFLSILMFLFTASLSTQNNKKAESPAAYPKIVIALGGAKGGNISPETLGRIIDSTLTASDEKGNRFTVVRFRSIYKFKNSYEDPQTGERKTADDMRVNDFSNTNQMSELWRQSIKDNAAKGDQMILDNIIVRLKNGNKIMAPAITFNVTGDL